MHYDSKELFSNFEMSHSFNEKFNFSPSSANKFQFSNKKKRYIIAMPADNAIPILEKSTPSED